jgi:hypothetical protein
MRKTIIVSCAFGLLVLCAGCATTKVAVSATHAPVTAYQANEGHLNTPAYEVGDLVAMDPQTKAAWRVMSVPVRPAEMVYGQPADGKAEPFVAPLDLAYSAKVPESVRGDVEEAVRGNTEFHVDKVWTRAIKSPATFGIAHPEMTKKMAQVRESNPSARFFLVTAVTAADKVYLTYGESGASRMVVGRYQFNFNYAQNGELERLAKQTPAFFALTPVGVGKDAEGRTVAAMDTAFAEDVPQYSFAETSAAW